MAESILHNAEPRCVGRNNVIALPTAAQNPLPLQSYRGKPPAVVVPRYRLDVVRRLRAKAALAPACNTGVESDVLASMCERVNTLVQEVTRLAVEAARLKIELQRAGIRPQ